MSRIPKPHPGIMAVMLPFVILLLLLIAFDPVKAMSRDDDSPPRVVMGENADGHPTFTLQNEYIDCTVTVAQGRIQREDIVGQAEWLAEFGGRNARLEMDGGFALILAWNAAISHDPGADPDKPLIANHQDFLVTGQTLDKGTLILHLRHDTLALEADLVWTLDEDDFFVRRRLSLRDPGDQGHRLQSIGQRHGVIFDTAKILNVEPGKRFLAFTIQDGGAFLDLEQHPGVITSTPAGCGALKLESLETMDVEITAQGTAGQWCIAAITPEPDVQPWIDRYLKKNRQ